ncbi:MAG: hypothetical protein OQK32_01255, partial [Gammaproteobacteria bacterium]|nr:hypothetical protein [Gammaproteobacteria bacterium]
MRRLLLSGLFFISQSAFSGEIADTYKEGALGTKWGDTIENIKKVFPSGRRETYKDVVMYVVRDGQPIFNIKRKKNSEIIFGFNPEQQLNSIAISIQQENYSALLKTLDSKFSDHIMQSDNTTARIATWPKDDG